MRVCMITSQDERCGIATYGQGLMAALPEIEWTVVGHRDAMMQRFDGFDIVLLNYEGGLMQSFRVQDRISPNQRRVLILHTSSAGNNRNEFTAQFNRVVVHERTTEGFDFIPFAIPNPMTVDEIESVNAARDVGMKYLLGTAGFPFPHKGFPEVADAARLLNAGALIVAPVSHHCDALHVAQMCRDRGAFVATKWDGERGAIKLLACCDVAVFAYHGQNCAISGAVRLGIAAGCAIVVTPCRMFRDLMEDYPDEIEVAKSPAPEHIAAAVKRILESGKKPNRVIEETSWAKTAERYRKVFSEVVA